MITMMIDDHIDYDDNNDDNYDNDNYDNDN